MRQGRWSERGLVCDSRSQTGLQITVQGMHHRTQWAITDFEITQLLCCCRQNVQCWLSERYKHRRCRENEQCRGGWRMYVTKGGRREIQLDAKLFILPIILLKDAESTGHLVSSLVFSPFTSSSVLVLWFHISQLSCQVNLAQLCTFKVLICDYFHRIMIWYRMYGLLIWIWNNGMVLRHQ